MAKTAAINRIKPTRLQKAAFKGLSDVIRNKDKKTSMGAILQNAGYSLKTSESPTLVTESKGFLQLWDESGLSDADLISMLASDLRNKPNDRSKELTIAFKAKGLFKADNEQRSNPVNIPDADFIEIIRAYKIRK
jgi:hypothetical protein